VRITILLLNRSLLVVVSYRPREYVAVIFTTLIIMPIITTGCVIGLVAAKALDLNHVLNLVVLLEGKCFFYFFLSVISRNLSS